jgi:pre-mRNA-processing factor 6
MASTNKLAFLSQAPPPGYVAGLGRGATGFTTRSDIGPAREASSSARQGEDGEEDDGEAGEKGEEDDGRHEDAPGDQDPDNETGLFAGGVYERDDEEADRVWAHVDAQINSRRAKQREQREKEEMERFRQENPKIQAQFADLKRGLSNVTEDQWANLPEAGNITGKRRKAASKRESRDNRSFAVPDSVLLSNRDRNAVTNSIESSDGASTSLMDIGEARNKIFSHKLDEVGAAADGTASVIGGTSSTIDPKGYLTELSSTVTKTATEIGDIKKARSLLDSVIKTNPHHAPGWIAAARVEEVAGKMAIARKVIAQGCERCPKSEDVWLESVRLNTRDNAKVILAQAVVHLNQSVRIWLKATELENDTNSKKRVLRKSLEYIPNSVKLWKELVNLEESPEDARILLSGAVDAIPKSVDLWLALARLSEAKDAEAVLNKARAAIPTSHEIWIAAARLVEEQGEQDSGGDGDSQQKRLDTIISAALKRLTKAGAILNREQWLKEAEQVESEGSPRTSAAIVKATIGMDVEEEDRQAVWVADAQSCIERGHIATARSILAYTLAHFSNQASIWKLAAELERRHGSKEALNSLLEAAVTSCPKAEELWLLYAKEKWVMDRSIQGAREVLARAFDKNVGSELISLEAARLEYENGERHAAGILLQRARTEVGSARVWLKSILFDRDEGRLDVAVDLLRQALVKFPSQWKFHIMLGQLLQRTVSTQDGANVKAAREAFTTGCRHCPHAVQLWLAASRLEEQADMRIRSRALLEKARMHNAKSDLLWDEAACVEERSEGSGTAQAKMLLARALQECPSSGLLHAHAIWLEPKPSRKTKAVDALKRTDDDARVLNLIARLFWNEGKVESARKWLERTSKSDPDWGDGWAWWYKFEIAHGTADSQAAVVRRCTLADPRHGQVWQPILKDWQHPRRSIENMLKIAAVQHLRVIN